MIRMPWVTSRKPAASLVLLITAASAASAANGCSGARPSSPARSIADDSQPALLPIDATFKLYLPRIQERVTIDPDGHLRYRRTDNKNWGPNAADSKQEKTETREGRLSAQAKAELAGLFAGWDDWSSENYPSVPDGLEVSIRYGATTVTGGPLPTKVRVLAYRLREMARNMPVVPR